MSEGVAQGPRRLSTISESEPDEMDTDAGSHGPPEDSEWGRSSRFLCLADQHASNSTLSDFSGETYQSKCRDDCAAVLLTCLFCKFFDLCRMLPGTCGRAVYHCFPSCETFSAMNEPVRDHDCCTCKLDMDCGLLSGCQEASEFLELAMEVSQVCHH